MCEGQSTNDELDQTRLMIFLAKAISVDKPTTWLVFSSAFIVAKANENPAPVGLFLSGNCLRSSALIRSRFTDF
jgi:hypothetical protein